MTTHLGGCLCGQIRFQASADPIAVSVCHCRDCQNGSGGGPNYIALIPVAAFEITKGEPRVFVSKGDSGNDVGRGFCPDCGSPLFSELPGMPFIPVKVGAMDDPAAFPPTMHLWTQSAQAWHTIAPGLPSFPRQPGG